MHIDLLAIKLRNKTTHHNYINTYQDKYVDLYQHCFDTGKQLNILDASPFEQPFSTQSRLLENSNIASG